MLSFVVENSLILRSIYPKSPRHLILNKLTGAHALRLFLKYINSGFFNKLANDNQWYHYKFFRYTNKSTISANLSLTSCYFLILTLLEKNFRAPCNINLTKYIFKQADVLALPASKRVNNSTLIILLVYTLNNYPALRNLLKINREYIFLVATLQKYTNLNFYYLRIFSH